MDSFPTTPGIRPPKAKKPKRDHQDGQRSSENSQGHKPASKNRRHTGPRSEVNPSANKGNRRRPAGAANNSAK